MQKFLSDEDDTTEFMSAHKWVPSHSEAVIFVCIVCTWTSIWHSASEALSNVF